MIRAFLFDLDGTLVQTEKMKAQAYAIAIQHLRKLDRPYQRAIKAYQEIIGVTQDVASQHITEKLGLEKELRPLMKYYGSTSPAQVLRTMWTEIYPKMVADPQTLRDNQWPHTVELLRISGKTCFIGIVTGSPLKAVLHVLHSIGIESLINLIVSGDDVQKGKPDPESYLLAAEKLGVSPEECLALEDSVNGVKAALAAGMKVVAIATPFTNAGLHTSEIVADCQIVHAPDELAETVRHMIEEHGRDED